MVEQLHNLAKEYWYVLLIGIGILLIVGAILKWKWVLETQGDRPFGFLYWINDLFGETGYRIAIIFIGTVIIAATVVMVVFI